MNAPTDAATIARGEYLARHVYVCIGCHSKVHDDIPGDPPIEEELGVGRDFGDIPRFPGHIRAQNITSDKEAGIGAWTDGEIVRAMREGVDKSGRALFPIMPYPTYAKTMSDDDALAVVAYIRTLSPSKNVPGPMEVNFPVSMFARAVPKPVGTAAPPPPADGIERGRWLLQACSCTECHTPTDTRHNPLPGMYLAGGTEFSVPTRGTVYVANITSDKETGIGAWTDDEVYAAIKTGVGKTKPTRALYAMPWPYYGGMTDPDLRALVKALREVPPVKSRAPDAKLTSPSALR
jgi:mono/diheme cytochrome c family protein